MSRCYNLGCIECKESIWVGQASGGGKPGLYSAHHHVTYLAAWLAKHEGHKLVFAEDQVLESRYECVELDHPDSPAPSG